MSLRLKLVTPLALACLAALAYLEFAWTPHALETQKRDYLKDVERHVDTVVEALMPLMLASQLDVMHENLDELKKTNPEWKAILLTDSRGRQLYPPASDPPQAPPAGASVHVLDKRVRILDRDLGRLVVHVDYASRAEQIRRQHRQLTVLVVIVIGLLALAWTASLEVAVVRRLRRLSVAADELARRHFDAPLPPPGDDEVGLLVANFAAMRDSLARSHDSLERRVAERTAELERALKDMEGFSYSVSHDLRAPLRAIHGYSKILRESEAGRLSDDGRRMLDRIGENAVRLGRLIDDILEYSRSSRVEMKADDVDLGVLARRAADELAELHPGTAVEIGDLPMVRGDRIMLGQVMQNLLGNAFKFSASQPGPKVTVGCTEKRGERAFFVRDNGVGFDMRYAAKLFGMFERLHREGEFPGTGVGLAIVKRVIERHGGRVWAESELGKGATFYFTLGAPAG